MASTYKPGPEASFAGPKSTPSKWVGTDCRSMLTDLKTNIDSLMDKSMRRLRAKDSRLQKDTEDRKSGGLLDKIMSGPLSAFKERSASVSNAQDQAKGARGLADRFVSYLDTGAAYAGLALDFASGVTNTVADELAVVNQISDAAGFGSVIPNGQSGGCNTNLLVGTVESIVRVAENAVAAQARQAFTAQATLGLAIQAVPDLYSAMMSMPAGTLSILLTNKKKILDRIEGVIRQVVSLAGEIRAADYPTDHRALIRWAMGELGEAGDYLGQVEQVLSAGGKFLTESWDKARDQISDTGDTLLRAESRFPTDRGFVKMLQLLAFQKDLETLIDVLDQRQALYQKFVGYIGSFTAEFSSAANFKNMSGPFIQQVRCALQIVLDDMARSLDRNSIIQYYLKEKQWGVELVQIAVMMDATRFMGMNMAAPSTEMKAATDSLSKQVSENSESFMQAEDYQRMKGLLNDFIREIRRKIASNVDPEVLAGVGDAILTESTRMRSVEDGLASLLAGFNNDFAEAGLIASQALAGIMDIFGSQGLEGYTEALLKGDLKEVFGLNALKASAETKTRKLIGDLLQCCQDNAGDGDSAVRLRRMMTVVQTLQRQKEIYDRNTKGLAERYSTVVNRSVLPAIRSTKADVSRLSTSACMNSSKSQTTGEPAALTLL